MKLASFLFGLILTAVIAFLALPSLSYAQSSGQVTVSAVVLEHITYYENSGNITVQTNIDNETIVIRQDDGVYVTVRI